MRKGADVTTFLHCLVLPGTSHYTQHAPPAAAMVPAKPYGRSIGLPSPSSKQPSHEWLHVSQPPGIIRLALSASRRVKQARATPS